MGLGRVTFTSVYVLFVVIGAFILETVIAFKVKVSFDYAFFHILLCEWLYKYIINYLLCTSITTEPHITVFNGVAKVRLNGRIAITLAHYHCIPDLTIKITKVN